VGEVPAMSSEKTACVGRLAKRLCHVTPAMGVNLWPALSPLLWWPAWGKDIRPSRRARLVSRTHHCDGVGLEGGCLITPGAASPRRMW
jgi:hypothetical protein